MNTGNRHLQIDSSSGYTGIVLVHGIGEQPEGATLDKFLLGLTKSVEAAVVSSHEPRMAVVTIGDSVLRIYEAWWADILSPAEVEGSFDEFGATEIAWLPWQNLLHDLYGKWGKVKAVCWTLLLRPLVMFLPVMLMLISSVYWPLKRVLERFVGDVPNYLNSAGRALPDDSPLLDVSEEVSARFVGAVEDAKRDGCSRIIVIGHSLGSVVAYHGLTGCVFVSPKQRFDHAASQDSRSLITNFITIGSPLEKIRFFWPLLIPSGDNFPRTVHWDNIRDRLDLVAGRLHSRESFGPVEDHALVGRAWLLTAHTAYERNPYFMRLLLGCALIEGVGVERTNPFVRVGLFLASIGLSILCVIVALAPCAITLAVLVIFCVILAISISIKGSTAVADGNWTHFEQHLSQSFHWGLWFAPILLFLSSLAWGYDEADERHWAFRHHRWPSDGERPRRLK